MKFGHGKLETVGSLEGAVAHVIEEQWGSVHMRSEGRMYQGQVMFESGRLILGVMVRIILESHFGQVLLVKLRQDFGYLKFVFFRVRHQILQQVCRAARPGWYSS